MAEHLSKSKPAHGAKTHELQQRIINREENTSGTDREPPHDPTMHDPNDQEAAERASGVPADSRGMFQSRDPHENRESRDHNKHNNPGQEGHKRQKHTPDQEKQG